MTAFASTPYRPVGLATADQGMASVVQLLEWCTVLVADATDGHPNLDQAAQPDRDLFAMTAVVLRQTGDLLAGTSQRGSPTSTRWNGSARPPPPTTSPRPQPNEAKGHGGRGGGRRPARLPRAGDLRSSSGTSWRTP